MVLLYWKLLSFYIVLLRILSIYIVLLGILSFYIVYMTSDVGDESNGPSNAEVYGFSVSDASNEAFEGFIDAFEKYNSRANNATIQEFLTSNKNKKLDDVKILGAMVTGQTKNFKALENQAIIRGASVGATAQIVPYIKPEK